MRETIQLYWTSIVELLAERLNIDRRKQCCTFRLKVVLTTVIICLVLFGAAGFAVLYKWDNCTGVANSGHKSPLFDSNDPDVKKIMAKGGPKVRKSDMPKTTTTTTTTTTNPSTNESRDLKPKTKPKLVIENLIPSTSSLPSSITRSPSSLVPHKDRRINVMGLDPTLPPPPPPNQGLLDQTPKRSTTIWSLIDQIRNNINQPTPCPPGHHLVVITTPDSASSNSNTRLARRQTSNDSPQSISLICKLFFGHTPPIPANDNDDIINKLTSGAHEIVNKVDEVTTQSTPKSLKIFPERVDATPDPSLKRSSKGPRLIRIETLPTTKKARTRNPFLRSLETTTPTPTMNIFDVQEFKPTTTTTLRPKRILTRRPTRFWPKPPTPTPRTTPQPTTTPAPSATTKLKPQPPTKPPPNWKTVLKEILCKKICTENPSNGGLLCHCDGPPMYIYQMPSKPYFVVSDALGY